MELGRNFIVICSVVPFPVTISVGSHVGGKSDDAQVVTIVDNTWQGGQPKLSDDHGFCDFRLQQIYYDINETFAPDF